MLDISSSEMNKRIKKTTSVVLMGTLCAVSIFSVKTFARDVYINVDNTTIHSITVEENVDNILNKMGVSISENDVVEKVDDPDGTLKLNVKRAFDVKVIDGDNQVKLKVVNGKVRDALKTVGIELGDSDAVNFALVHPLEKDMNIVISRRVKIQILADGEEKEYLMPKLSVREALGFAGLKLSENDEINVNFSSNIYEGMKIVINRIKFEEIVTTKKIPYKVVTKNYELLDKGEEKVSIEGKDGTKEIKSLLTLKDNEVIDSKVTSEKILEEPVDKVILKGTRVINSSSSSSPKKDNKKKDNKEKSSKVIYGSATAYTALSGARTSTGKSPIEGETVAVNPRVIPYGSKILVESTDGSFKKTLVAQDTGGALKSGSALVDIYMKSESACRQFGRKSVKVSILS